MKLKKLSVLLALPCLVLLTACPKKITTQNQQLPAYDQNISAKIYYELWREAEDELEECVNLCDTIISQ